MLPIVVSLARYCLCFTFHSLLTQNYTCSLRVHQNVAGLKKGTSDPFAVVTQLNTSDVGRGQAVVLGKTEV